MLRLLFMCKRQWIELEIIKIKIKNLLGCPSDATSYTSSCTTDVGSQASEIPNKKNDYKLIQPNRR